jgi:hypothetical protein
VVPSKNVNDSRRSDPLAFLGKPISAGRNEEKWFPRKNAAVPLRTRFLWLPLRERARPGGMRKSGSFEKSMAPLVGLTSGRRSEQRE